MKYCDRFSPRNRYNYSEKTYLAVVHSEVKMVQGMMRRPVDDLLQWMTSDHVGIMDKNTPKVDGNEEEQVKNTVKREKEDEQMVGHGLEVAVDGVKRVRRERRRN